MRIDECPVKTAVDVIGGKWKPLILYALKDQTLRFEQLKRCVPGASQKVLTEQLRQLRACDVVERKEISSRLPHTEYRLTPYGQTLLPALAALAEWGARHRARKRQE